MIIDQRPRNLKEWVKRIDFEIHTALYEEVIRMERQLTSDLMNSVRCMKGHRVKPNCVSCKSLEVRE